MRGTVEAASNEHRTAALAWVELVGPEVDVHHAKASRPRSWRTTALRNLGGAADEIEQLRTDLAERAEPAVAAPAPRWPRPAPPTASPTTTSPTPPPPMPGSPPRSSRVAPPGSRASSRRREAKEQDLAASSAPSCSSSGSTPASSTPASALEWAVARAAEREEARANARPREVIEAELEDLQETARRLRRPEWATVSPSEADAPDIGELEERREKLLVRLDEVQPDTDVVRLADRQAAVERRVMALEARHGGPMPTATPGAVADIQQHLLGRLTAGRHRRPPRRPGARRCSTRCSSGCPPSASGTCSTCSTGSRSATSSST